MSIEPVAWAEEENVDVCEYGIKFQFPAHSTKLNENMIPLYPQSAIDELQRQLTEAQSKLKESVGGTKRDLAEKLEQQKTKAAKLERQLAEQYEIVDKLLEHCPEGECYVCSEIVCPHKCTLHFHHDGCPACAEYEGEQT